MTTQYTSILKLALPVQGELSGTWGDVVNDNITSMVEEAVAGRAVINTWTTNSHTLTTADGTTSEARCSMLEFTDTGTALTGAATVVCPTASKLYVCKNDAGQQVTIQTSGGTGVAIPDGQTMFVFCDGTNVEQCTTNFNSLSFNDFTLNFGGAVTTAGAFTTSGAYALTLTATGATNVTLPTTGTLATLDGTETLTNKTLTAPTISSPTLTGAISATDLTISGNTTIGDAASDTVTVNGTFTSNLIFTDDTYDIGATGATRPRNLFLSGNATIGGTVTLAGGIDVTGALGVDGDFDVNTDKFTVASATGNTVVAGTLGITGETTATGNLKVDTINEITAAGGVTIDSVLLKDGGATLTGDLTVDTDTLYVDSTNNRVGIGTSSPSKSLHILNASSTGSTNPSHLRIEGNSSNYYDIGRDNSGTGYLSFYGSQTGATGYIFGGVDGERMRIDSSGNVGIGTSSPTYALDVESNNSGGLVASFVNTATNIPQGVLIDFPNSTPNTTNRFFLKMEDSTSVKAEIDTTGGGYFMGNVGIGTDSPSDDLEINPSADEKGITLKTTNSIRPYFNFDANRSGANQQLGRIQGKWNGNIVTRIEMVAGSDTTNKDDGFITFQTASSSSDLNERMRLDSSGNLGIGTSSITDARLEVSGGGIDVEDGGGTPRLRFYDGITFKAGIEAVQNADSMVTGSVAGDFGIRSQSNMLFATGGSTERMRIDSSGNVGIGTTSPNARLEVEDAGGGSVILKVTADDSSPYAFIIGNDSFSTTDTDGLGLWMGSDGQAKIDARGTGAYHTFRVQGTERVRIDTSGNLLVGKTTTGITDAGVSILGGSNDGTLEVRRNLASANTSSVGYISRGSTDGNILQFYKDTTHIGSIGTKSSGLFIGSDDAGIFFNDHGGGDLDAIYPYDVGTDTFYNGHVDIGGSSNKFRNIHISGSLSTGDGITFGDAGGSGTSTSNTLDSYEEGTWTPVGADASSGGNTASAGTTGGFYTKIGRQVTVNVTLANINTSGLTGGNGFYIQGLPFTHNSTSPRNVTGVVRADKVDVDPVCYGVVALISAGATSIQLYQNRDNTTDIQILVSALQSGTADIFVTLTYDAA